MVIFWVRNKVVQNIVFDSSTLSEQQKTGGIEVEASLIPVDFTGGKYMYTNGEIVLNPDYAEPVDTDKKILELETQIEELTLAILSGGQ